MPLKDYQKRAKDNYRAKTTQVSVEFNRDTEMDLIEFLNKQPSKQRFIKQLIINAMAEEIIIKDCKNCKYVEDTNDEGECKYYQECEKYSKWEQKAD